MNKFIIITPGRSGSTHLVQTLNHHSQIKCDEEIFNRSNRESGSFICFLKGTFALRMLGWFFNREKLSTISFNFPLNYLIRLFISKKANDSASIYGFKLTLDQWKAYSYVLKYAARFNYKLIYLTRKDKLKMVLSLLKARQSGNYENPDSSKYHFDSEEVVKNMGLLRKGEDELLGLCEKILVINYEELFEKYNSHLVDILDFIGAKNEVIEEKSDLRKVNPDELEDWVENLDEIRQSIRF